MKNHPAADIFPMLTTDELGDLADDIEANGQQFPIVVFEKQIIDGRNRQAACELRKLTPEYVEFNGTEDDVVPFVISTNLARRHMTKGQRAMAGAMMSALNNSELGRSVGVDDSYISIARQVLKASQARADQVLGGTLSLGDAHKKTKAASVATSTDEERLAALNEKHPDLAERVPDDVTLDEAVVIAKERDYARKTELQSFAGIVSQVRFIAQVGLAEQIDTNIKDAIDLFDLNAADAKGKPMSSVDVIEAAIGTLQKVKEQMT